MSGLANWRSNTLNQQRQQQNLQLNQQYLVVQQQRVQQKQEKLQDNYNTLNTTLLNPNNRTLTINGQSSITCDILSINGGNNQIATKPLKDITYVITNNTNWQCVVSWTGTGNIFNGIIPPNSGTTSGSTLYADSNTITMLFTDPNNDKGWTYKGTFTYSNTGNPTVSFQAAVGGYVPITMQVIIGNTINKLIRPGAGGEIQLSSTPMSDGTPWNITFRSVPIQPINVNFLVDNETPYLCNINGTTNAPDAPGTIPFATLLNVQYDVNNAVAYPFSCTWEEGSSTNPTLILSGGQLIFNAVPASGTPALSIITGTESSLFNYQDISVTVTARDTNSTTIIGTPLTVLVGNSSTGTPLLQFSDIQNYINTYPGGTLQVLLKFNAQPQLPLINNFAFTNNTPYQIAITTSSDFSTASLTPITANGGTGTWTESIQPYDNAVPTPHLITWTATNNSNNYSGKCTTTLLTSNSGQGIVCTLNNVVGSGISTTLSFNGTTIIADIYGNLAVPQASIPLPPQASTPNTYAITLTAGQLTDCVYSLIVTNNTSKGISYNGGAIVNGTPLNVLVTVTNGQTLASGLVWSGLANWGGPSSITVTCKSDGTGYVSSIDHGSFSTDYQPTMTATVSGNPNTFTQTGGQSGSAWNTFLNNLPATGGSINLTFTDS